MTLQNAGITHLLDRIVNLVGARLNSEINVSKEPVVIEMMNMWKEVVVPGKTIKVGENLKVEISDNGDYKAGFGVIDITSGVLLDCKDGYGDIKAAGGA